MSEDAYYYDDEYEDFEDIFWNDDGEISLAVSATSLNLLVRKAERELTVFSRMTLPSTPFHLPYMPKILLAKPWMDVPIGSTTPMIIMTMTLVF